MLQRNKCCKFDVMSLASQHPPSLFPDSPAQGTIDNQHFCFEPTGAISKSTPQHPGFILNFVPFLCKSVSARVKHSHSVSVDPFLIVPSVTNVPWLSRGNSRSASAKARKPGSVHLPLATNTAGRPCQMRLCLSAARDREISADELYSSLAACFLREHTHTTVGLVPELRPSAA